MKISVCMFARAFARVLTGACAVLLSVYSASTFAQTAAAESAIEPDRPEEMLVVASRLPTAAAHIGSSVTVLNEQHIADLDTGYGADLLRHIPGVAVSHSGGFGGPTQVRLRGAEANHVVVLIDGINVTAAESGEFDFSSLLTQGITRIEVLRGPQSGLYGSNAMAGVISIQTQHGRPPADGFDLSASLEAGEYATRHGHIALGLGNERVNGWLSYAERRAELDISTDDSIMGAEDDREKNQTVLARINATVTDALTLQAFARITDRATDTDGFDFSGGPTQGLPIDDDSRTQTDDMAIGGKALLQVDHFTGSARFSRTTSDLNGGFFGSESERTEITLDAAFNWEELSQTRQRTMVYVQSEEESFRNPFPSDPSQAPTFERDMTGVGIEHQIGLSDWLFINGAYRHDNNEKFDDADTYSINTSLITNAGQTRIHASLGTAVTNPTFFEQFGFVPGNFVGNPDLRPEESRGWDIGVEQKLLAEALIIDLTYFDAILDNEIQSQFPTVRNTDGHSKRSGLELSFSWRTDLFDLTGHYTYIDAAEPTGDEVRRPKHTAALNFSAPWQNRRGRFTAGAIYNGSMLDTDFRNFFANGFVTERTRLDSYVALSLGASYALSEALEAYVRIENAFDDDYEELIGYATPGRSVYAGLRIRL